MAKCVAVNVLTFSYEHTRLSGENVRSIGGWREARFVNTFVCTHTHPWNWFHDHVESTVMK